MKMKFTNLTLQCKKSRENIKFSPHVSFFHGKISSGKSSIARLIDFCLGGHLERVPALEQELVSVQLTAYIGDYEVLFEREAQGSNQVQVAWRDEKGSSGNVLIPIVASKTPIWGDNIYNLSDLIFYLGGLSPVKIPRSIQETESEMVRLSFRDIMWYCYMEQEYLDSSFFWLDTPMKERKSRYVMRFIVGEYTERLNEFETELKSVIEHKMKKEEEIIQLQSFLNKFGYSSESHIMEEIDKTNKELIEASLELSKMRDGYAKETHFVDDLRGELRLFEEKLSKEEQILTELRGRITEQESLKAELILAKFKLARSESAKGILAGVFFEYCPSCGMELHNRSDDKNVCPLCGQHYIEAAELKLPEGDMIRLDLDSRIKELEESIVRHRKSFDEQKLLLDRLQEEKSLRDRKLDEELKNYDSKFLSYSRATERQIATFEERIKSLRKMLEMPKAVDILEKEAETLSADEDRFKREIKKEKENLDVSEKLIQDIEYRYLESLLAVGLPGIKENDQVKINRTTWVPDILPAGREAGKWNFFNAGSAGKKTLLNVCFALAVHQVAVEYNLPLPTFLIIDTPMKNIGEDVNKEIFEAFYNHLYDLVQGPLSNTQFIIIDKEYFPPKAKIEIFERYMTTDNDNYPPLISYYHGH